LRRCISNLLDNAARYGGGAQGQLTEDAQGVCVTVRDRGPGIPEAELSQVLQPFYRVEASRNRNTGGVGLGLASASDIARQHGGGITLRNRVGGGLQAGWHWQSSCAKGFCQSLGAACMHCRTGHSRKMGRWLRCQPRVSTAWCA